MVVNLEGFSHIEERTCLIQVLRKLFEEICKRMGMDGAAAFSDPALIRQPGSGGEVL